MQKVSGLYKEIVAGSYKTECRLLIAEEVYSEWDLIMLRTSRRTFGYGSESAGAGPSVGGCIVGTIDVEMWLPEESIPRQARMVPQVRITDGYRFSEWLTKGVYYIDTRKERGTGKKRLILSGYDDLMKAEQYYPASSMDWPAKDIDVVQEIANYIGVEIDPRTIDLMKNGYAIQYPGGEYSCRETLGYIAALYGGNFVMNDIGQLRLLVLNSIPKATRYLVDRTGAAITFGGVRILV